MENLEIVSASYLGGQGEDSAWGVTVGPAGDVIVAGISESLDLPGASGTFQTRNGGRKDAFVARLRAPDYRSFDSTYLGGSGDDESGYDGSNVKTDSKGNIWLVGITESPNLPVKGAFQPEPGGNTDGFIAALTSDLKDLCFATYHGGPGRDLLEGIAVSSSGKVAVTGVSFSGNQEQGYVALPGNPPVFARGRATIFESAKTPCGASRN